MERTPLVTRIEYSETIIQTQSVLYCVILYKQFLRCIKYASICKRNIYLQRKEEKENGYLHS